MKRFMPAFLFLFLFFLYSGDVWAGDSSLVDLVESTGYSSAVKVLLVLTLFSFLPAMVLTMTEVGVETISSPSRG